MMPKSVFEVAPPLLDAITIAGWVAEMFVSTIAPHARFAA
jgi:hypothetical protein